MVKVKLFLNRNVNENANFYFEKAKKLKAKLPGLEKALVITKKEIADFESKKEEYIVKKEKEEKLKIHKKKEWYDKFRWTLTSGGYLFVIGKDAGTNEILIKKHMEENDLVFHTQAAGSPFGLLKNGKDKVGASEILECAEFLGCFSSSWKAGFGSAEVFWVLPEQVSKKAESGEYISRGSFMVRGNKNILKNVNLRICLGVRHVKLETEDGVIEYDELFSGSESSCKKVCGNRFVKIEAGQNNYKTLTKEIKKRLKISVVEDLPKYIPNDCKVLKR